MKGVLSCLLALVLVFSITPSVFAEEPVGGTTIYVDATNGDDTQEGVGTTSDKAYKTVAAAVAAAHSGDTIQLGTGNYTLYKVDSTGYTDVNGSNDSLYAEGYKDHALVTTYGEWIAKDDGTISRAVTKTCTYCGYDEEVTQHQVKLTYNANGGEGATNPATGAAGESETVAENVFTRNNYTFTGWNTQADGKGTAYKPGDSFTLTDKDTVLYAQWSKNAPAQVNVSYDANGGTGTMESITDDVGSKIVTEQNGFARSGHTFTGWNTQADGKGTAYKPGDIFTLTDKDTVLYAQWSKNSGSAGTGTNGTAKPTDSPETGDNSNLALWFALLFVSGGVAIGTTVVSRKKKYNR